MKKYFVIKPFGPFTLPGLLFTILVSIALVALFSFVSEAQSTTQPVKTSFSLGQNIPNPFSGLTEVTYLLPEKYSVAVIVLTDSKGATLKTIKLKTASGTVQFQTGELTSGIYQYSLVVDGKVVATNQMEFFN
jgi:hypothetical protein